MENEVYWEKNGKEIKMNGKKQVPMQIEKKTVEVWMWLKQSLDILHKLDVITFVRVIYSFRSLNWNWISAVFLKKNKKINKYTKKIR